MAPRQDSPWAVYRRLLSFARPYWKGFAVAVCAMVVLASTDPAFAAVIKRLLDSGFVNKDADVIRGMALMIIGLFLLRGVADFTSTYCMAWVGRHVISDLRRRMFNQLLRMPTTYYDQTSSGQLISKLTYDVEQVSQASTSAVTTLVRDSLTIVGLLAWMIYLNGWLALVFVLVGPPIALLMTYVNRRFRRVARGIQSSMGNVTHVVEEAIEGHRVIKTFGGQEYEAKQFEEANRRNLRMHMKMVITSASSVPVIQFIAAMALVSIIFLATLPPMLEKITPGTFMSFIVAMTMLLAPIKRLTSVNAAVQKGIAASQSIFELLDSAREVDKGGARLERARGAVEYRQVSFRYDAAKGDALRDVCLEIEPGQCVAFVGRSGGGKSTLVSLLPRFYDINEGAILLDGRDIRDYSLCDLRRQIAWVGQDVVLFNNTIARNIAYGRDGEVSKADIMRAAEAAHAMEFIRQMPDGLNTLVGENGILLSGGQRQRLAIARALLKDAPVLILDEATSALDSESERHIQAALAELMRNRTTLVIAHRLSTIEQADLIVVVHRGCIVETGRHEELLKRDGHYAALHRMQFATHGAAAASH